MEGGGGNGEKFNLFMRMNGDGEEDDEMELSLGLSMNGRFGVDPLRNNLKRSFSVSNFSFTAVDNGISHQQASGMEIGSYAPLVRTSSLPIETEEEWHRRKELQFMRRMEARTKRMKKLKNGNNNNVNGVYEVFCGHGQRVLDKIQTGNGMPLLEEPIQPLKNTPSGNYELLCQLIHGGGQDVEVPPSNPQHSLEHGVQEPASRSPHRDVNEANKLLKNAIPDMPYVTTKEAGGDGRKIEGFLYRYRKGEEVRIVCVCHGIFLTPAEFIKHGGCGDVENPLKHIVVEPFPLI